MGEGFISIMFDENNHIIDGSPQAHYLKTGKSLYEIHTLYVEELKKRGEKIYIKNISTPNCTPSVLRNCLHCFAAGTVLGYDKTVGCKTAGYIYQNISGFELHQDHLTGIHPVKWADIGLCEARCRYQDEEQAEKIKYEDIHTTDKDKLKEINKAVGSVNMFSSEANQHKQR